MSDYKELSDEGYMKLDVLVHEIALCIKNHPSTVKMLLTKRMPKIRALLVANDEIVQPDNFAWQCVYAPRVQYKLSAFLMWHDFDTRRSVAQCVMFLRAFDAREEWAMRYLPKRLHKNLAPAEVVSIGSRRLRRA